MPADLDPAWTLADPHALAAEAPYTFYLPKFAPSRPAVGDHVKLMFEQTREGRSNGGERMWVTITVIDRDTLTGVLATEPFDFPELTPGQIIRFERRLILDAVDPEGEPLGHDDTQRDYWDRCVVDDAVLYGGARVAYLVREAPTPANDGERFDDSGWRLYAAAPDPADPDAPEPTVSTVALGAVLNRDDSWLPLLDAQEGAAFRRTSSGGFEPAE